MCNDYDHDDGSGAMTPNTPGFAREPRRPGVEHMSWREFGLATLTLFTLTCACWLILWIRG